MKHELLEKVARALHEVPRTPWEGIAFDDLPHDAKETLLRQAALAIAAICEEMRG